MLDVIIVIMLVAAVFQGLRDGLVLGFFSMLAFILGLAAALKFSVAITTWFPGDPKPWWPFAGFLLVFLITLMAVNLIGKVLHQTTQWAMLGWLNRLGGVAFYVLLYGLILSVFLFYVGEMGWISEKTKSGSYFYGILQPLAPEIMAITGMIIPVFRDMFDSLQEYFGNRNDKISA